MKAGAVLPVDDRAIDETPAPPRTLLSGDTLAQSLIALVALAVAQRLVGFGRSVLVCGWLPPDQLGEWDLANRFFILAAPLVVLGLPGSFGRYLEHYRQRGVLRCVLFRTVVVCALLAVVAMLGMLAAPEFIAGQVFGRGDRAPSVAVLAIGLVAVIAYNYVTAMLTALRLVRVSSLVQFFHSLAFAGLCVALLGVWRLDALSIVVAYTGGCLLLVLVAIFWLAAHWRDLPRDCAYLPSGEMWRKLAPFAVWVWVTNLLYNLFEVVDRYMLLHIGELQDAQALVGQYHSAQVVPALFVSVASLLAAMILPHLSRDWEWGDRARVTETLNLTLKLLGLATFAGSVALLFAAPLLFDLAWDGKYAQGMALLPLALASCGWLGLLTVAQMYLWCAERATLSCISLAIGLVLNVVLNLALIPAYGLPGAVVATTTSNFAVLGIVLALNRGLGMRVHRSTVCIALLPAALLLERWMALAVLGGAMVCLFASRQLLSASEKSQIASVWQEYYRKVTGGPSSLRSLSHPTDN
jgi:O-antigen/teichoic acid export membrane protein